MTQLPRLTVLPAALTCAALAFVGCTATPSATAPAPAPATPSEPAPVEAAAMAEPESPIEVVAQPSANSPLVAVRLLFKVGSIHDPAGKEGLASLTGLMLGQSATSERSYKELVDALYPMAAAINVTTDREVTVISGAVHRERLAEYLDLMLEAVLSPGFAPEDFERHRAQLTSYLQNTLRASNDELLGLEAIQQVIFSDHPYGHAPQGSIQGLASLTLDDVRDFYSSRFTQSNLMLGLAGGYPEDLPDDLVARLSTLPAGEGAELMALPEPVPVEGRQITLIEKPTDSVGIHFGYALPINRSHPDYYPLMVANSFLGEHRTFHGRLMKQLRGKRGLNYGDYSYIEYWHLPPFTSNPGPNVPRRQQFFSVWVRPVVPNTAHFAFRNALYEVERLIELGMTKEEFELTRDFVVNYSKLWAQSPANRLGFAMDSRYYGMDYYIDEIDERLASLTLEDVNAAIRKYIRTDDFHGVFVTAGAAEVEAYLAADEPSPMTYNAPPEDEVVEADKTIEKISVGMAGSKIVAVQQMFEGGSE